MKNAVTHARQHSAPGTGERERADHLASVDGLVFGEDPSEGFVRGRRYLHPKLGFTFTAPEGFVLENTAQAVLGAKEGGSQAMRLDVVRVPAEQTLTDYLKSGWIGTIDEKSVEPVTISGFPAATATAKGDQWTFRMYAVRFGSEVYRFIYATKQKTPESERAFRDSINSFRRMSSLGDRRRATVAHQSGDGGPERHAGAPRRSHGDHRPAGAAFPCAQRIGARTGAKVRRSGQDRGGIRPQATQNGAHQPRAAPRRLVLQPIAGPEDPPDDGEAERRGTAASSRG